MAELPQPERRTGRWLRLGLRARLTIATTVLVALALAAGAVLLTAVVQRSLARALDDAARQRASDVAALVDAGTVPATLPVAGDTVAVQVLDERGAVVAASPGGDRLVPLVSGSLLASVRRGHTVTLPGSRLGIAGSLRVLGTTAGGPAAPRTVLVAVSATEAASSLHVVRLALLVGGPLLAAGFGLACWALVGAALRPVDGLRRGAEEISGTDASGRLPVPVARDEVHDLAVTLNGMIDRLALAGERQRGFVADAAHELRNPLASVRTQLEVARLHPARADWEETADGALTDLERLSHLVDDLLLLARLDERPPRPATTVDLGQLVHVAVGRTRAGTGIHLSVDDTTQQQLVTGDVDGLGRVLDNLLTNAVRHAASTVAVQVRSDGPEVALTVTDDGPGVAEEDRERVFERFARLDESRSRGQGGSGLGLAIVRQIVLAHGGSVRLEDASPGLRVVVRLPAATEQAAGR